jgi:hypothetical protein
MVTSISKILLILACVHFFGSIAYSCSCGGLPPPTFQSYPTSAVFIGLVTDVKHETKVTGPDDRGRVSVAHGPTRVRFVVEESFRGNVKEEIELEYFAGDSCAYNFEKDTKYLIYASERDDKLSVHKCSRTRPLSMADDDLKYIRGLKDEGQKGTIYGQIHNRVTRADGETGLRMPMKEITVIAEGENGEFKTLSQPTGLFEINNLVPGGYRIRIEGAVTYSVWLGTANLGQSPNHIPVKDREGTEITIVVTIPQN